MYTIYAMHGAEREKKKEKRKRAGKL